MHIAANFITNHINNFGCKLTAVLDDTINGRISPNKNNFTCVSTKGRSVVDYIVTTHDNLTNCTLCEVELVSDLIQKYKCISLLSDTCKAPDHSMLTLKMTYSAGTMVETVNSNVFESGGLQHNVNVPSNDKLYKLKNIPVTFMNSPDWRLRQRMLIDNAINCHASQYAVDELYDKIVMEVSQEMNAQLEHRQKGGRNVNSVKHSKPYWTSDLTEKWKNMRQAEKVLEMQWS